MGYSVSVVPKNAVRGVLDMDGFERLAYMQIENWEIVDVQIEF